MKEVSLGRQILQIDADQEIRELMWGEMSWTSELHALRRKVLPQVCIREGAQ